jgi:carnitine-CoA ligase
MYLFANIKNALRFTRAFLLFLRDERRRGTLRANFRSLAKTQEIGEDMSWAELIEEKARIYGDRPFLMFEDRTFTYRQMDENANRAANYLKGLGGGRGKGLVIMMGNCPRYLDMFIGSQKIGMYSIPINTSLRGDSLLYILNHS